METQGSKVPLLFLCHRIPYPPNKGDKIRSFHLLHHLSRYFDIYLASFVDDPADWPWVPEVEKYCRDSLFLEQGKWAPRIQGLTGLLTGQALSIPFYHSARMQDWVAECIERHSIERVMVYSSSMAQYALPHIDYFKRKVVDFVDIDSDKWQQYSERQSWPMSWLYRREARCLLSYEQQLAENFDSGLFVSSSEADLFRQLVPSVAEKIGYYNNGVNSDYFSPTQVFSSPYPHTVRPLVFTGAMDYWPNIDAVQWFVKEVLPQLRSHRPELYFYIVGSNPSKAVIQLASTPGVVVTGRVDDVRPYIGHAELVVAPVRVARGVQNKVLEGMAMAKVVVVTSKGLEGIQAVPDSQVMLANTPAEYVAAIDRALDGDRVEMGQKARSFVEGHFNWDSNLPEVVMLLEGEVPRAGANGERRHG
jgi:sugar transferase (PEP-CTERM/EpsH1 system associated)